MIGCSSYTFDGRKMMEMFWQLKNHRSLGCCWEIRVDPQARWDEKILVAKVVVEELRTRLSKGLKKWMLQRRGSIDPRYLRNGSKQFPSISFSSSWISRGRPDDLSESFVSFSVGIFLRTLEQGAWRKKGKKQWLFYGRGVLRFCLERLAAELPRAASIWPWLTANACERSLRSPSTRGLTGCGILSHYH